MPSAHRSPSGGGLAKSGRTRSIPRERQQQCAISSHAPRATPPAVSPDQNAADRAAAIGNGGLPSITMKLENGSHPASQSRSGSIRITATAPSTAATIPSTASVVLLLRHEHTMPIRRCQGRCTPDHAAPCCTDPLDADNCNLRSQRTDPKFLNSFAAFAPLREIPSPELPKLFSPPHRPITPRHGRCCQPALPPAAAACCGDRNGEDLGGTSAVSCRG